MFDIKEHYKISRSLAAESMVLLKNESNTLPFCSNDRVGIIGKECLSLYKAGGGSGAVKSKYVRTLPEGLREKAQEGKLQFCENSVVLAESTDVYTIDFLNNLADNIDKAIITFKRFGSETQDRQLGTDNLSVTDDNIYSAEMTAGADNGPTESCNFFYPSKRELQLFENIEKSNIKSVVLVLNIASTVDISYIEKFPKIKAVLLAYLPGMEGGTAIADVLSGDVNPSGKLVDTIACKYENYPSADSFNADPYITEYKEGIYVGYRYFETFAKDKVLYPFGYGLSYTEFEYSNYKFNVLDGKITVTADIKNIGSIVGREVVQVYVSAPKGSLEKPAIELKGFVKTQNLAPNETERVKIVFDIKDLSSFDDTGASGYKGALVLEKGDYKIFVGKSVRELYLCGCYNVPETTVAEQLTVRFDGSKYVFSEETQSAAFTENKNITLFDVADGKADIGDFINQLTIDELLELSQGQPTAFAGGTSGIGNLKKYGIPNPQTADGPAGIRRSVNTTCFPCGTLLACSWDSELQRKMGEAMGKEGASTGIDIILAPGMNIHRDPLCGRNFEYFSEDPLVTGKTAAAIVNGVQSKGMSSTLKHFAGNNREFHRKENNSVICERALREIYLKGFEIAVKEAKPHYIMTSYNKINGVPVSANTQLLRGVLRDEWHYKGAVMTDWWNFVPMLDEIIAGNNIKMPYGYQDEIEKVREAFYNGKITLDVLRENAKCIVSAVTKSKRFADKNFGVIHNITEGSLKIPVTQFDGTSSGRVSQDKLADGSDYLYHLGREPRAQRTFIYYNINCDDAGEYTVTSRISTNCPETQIWYYNEIGERIATAFCSDATDSEKWYDVDVRVKLHKGENMLKMVFACEPYTEYEPKVYTPIPHEDIKLSKILVTKISGGK